MDSVFNIKIEGKEFREKVKKSRIIELINIKINLFIGKEKK